VPVAAFPVAILVALVTRGAVLIAVVAFFIGAPPPFFRHRRLASSTRRPCWSRTDSDHSNRQHYTRPRSSRLRRPQASLACDSFDSSLRPKAVAPAERSKPNASRFTLENARSVRQRTAPYTSSPRLAISRARLGRRAWRGSSRTAVRHLPTVRRKARSVGHPAPLPSR
jgi:hypothetical protein